MKSLAKYLSNIRSHVLSLSQGLDATIEEVVTGVVTLEDESELVIEVVWNFNGACVLAQSSVSLDMLEELSEDEGFGLVIQNLMGDLSDKIVEQELVTIH